MKGNIMTDKICGRDVTIIHRGKFSAKIIVEGVTHPKGQPIKFKSRERAERHIKNMRLERR
jgi:hypothetical protein